MPYDVADLPSLIPSSSASTKTIGIGSLDDSASISLFFTSSANANSSSAVIQVSQFDPTILTTVGINSTAWYNLSTAIAVVASSGSQVVITNISFRGLRLSVTTSNAGEIIAFASKQINV